MKLRRAGRRMQPQRDASVAVVVHREHGEGLPPHLVIRHGVAAGLFGLRERQAEFAHRVPDVPAFFAIWRPCGLWNGYDGANRRLAPSTHARAETSRPADHRSVAASEHRRQHPRPVAHSRAGPGWRNRWGATTSISRITRGATFGSDSRTRSREPATRPGGVCGGAMPCICSTPRRAKAASPSRGFGYRRGGGLLAMLSVEAVRHAQDAREYSIDALLTAPIRQPRGRS